MARFVLNFLNGSRKRSQKYKLTKDGEDYVLKLSEIRYNDIRTAVREDQTRVKPLRMKTLL